jgi:uncharacterized protein (TIGR03067 family)
VESPGKSPGIIGNRRTAWLRVIGTMGRQLLFVFVSFLVTPMLALAKEPPSGDAVEVQGTWRFVELEANGAKKPAEEIEGWKVVFEGDDLWVVKPSGTDPKLKFKLDATRDPKTIDLVVQEGKDRGKVAPGIYALGNGQLRLCINIFGDPSYRPSEFKTREGDGVGFATLERVQAK